MNSTEKGIQARQLSDAAFAGTADHLAAAEALDAAAAAKAADGNAFGAEMLTLKAAEHRVAAKGRVFVGEGVSFEKGAAVRSGKTANLIANGLAGYVGFES